MSTTNATIPGALPEGTLDLPTTLRGMHLLRNQLAFQVDELQMDTPQNQLLCAGIRALLRSPDVKSELRDELRRQIGIFSEITYITNHEALRVEWTNHDAAYSSYREAVLATLPDESAHDQHWRKLLDDQERMGLLFEAFLCGFLRLEFAGRGTLTKPRFDWSDGVGAVQGRVPELRTDLMLEVHGSGRLTVGECKLYESPLSKSGRLRRDHVNQLFAYLSAAAAKYPNHAISGQLIYALVDDDFGGDVMLREFPVRIHNFDLHQPWPRLREQFVELWPT